MYIETKLIKITDLSLDENNPRLPGYLEREPSSIFRFLVKNSAIDELVSAIGENDFFASEPLIAVPNDQKITVVEGNRRLTALKLLSGDEFESMPNKLKVAVNAATHKPESVPVALYENREDVLNYLGNKHIAGVKPWGALAKARYARQLLDLVNDDQSYQDRIRQVARSIGSRSDFLSRALKALDAYQSAFDDEFYGLDGVDEESVKFSLLGTALDYEGIQGFVYDDVTKEVSERKFVPAHLKELFSWMFEKTENGKTRLGESRKLKELTKVVASEEGLKKFRQGLSLSQAYKLTDGIEEEFDNLTTRIQSNLQEANSIVADIEISDERAATSKSITRQAQQLNNAFN